MSNFEAIEEAIKAIKTTNIVSCPVIPRQVQGVSANTFTAGDAFGLLMEIQVPKRGEIRSATFFDLDNEGSQMDMEIFNIKPVQIASEAAWTLSVADNPKFVTELPFFAFDDHIDSQTSELTNIGKSYTAPKGKLYIQMVCRGTPDMASVAVNPMLQLQILSYDPDFKES